MFIKNGDSDLLSITSVTAGVEEVSVVCPHCQKLIKVTPDTKECPLCGGILVDVQHPK